MAVGPMTEEKLRLFLAIPLQEIFLDEIQQTLRSLKSKLPDIRWIKPEQVHLTLHFFGDTPASEVERIDEVLRSMLSNFSPLRVCLDGVGGFPDFRRPRVIWLGVHDETGGLQPLQKAVSAEMKKLGFEIEDRPFTPHVTLARVREKLPSELLETTFKKTVLPLPTAVKVADRFVLYRSRLLPQGAIHDILKTYSFTKTS